MNTGETIQGSPGETSTFSDLPSDNVDYTITGALDPAASSYAVFCKGDISNTRPYAAVSLSSGAPVASIMGLQPGENIECDWFWAASANVSIMHVKYVCPPDYEATAQGVEQMRTDCSEPVSSTGFEVTHGSDQVLRQTIDTTNHATTFANLTPGELTSIEYPAADGYFVAVFCAMPLSGSTAQLPFQRYDLNDEGELIFSITDGSVTCHWFNRAQQYEPHYLIVYKHECAPEVADSAPENQSADDRQAYFSGECPIMPDRLIELQTTESPGNTRHTDQDGKVVWENIPGGDFIVAEDMRTRSHEPVSVCRALPTSDSDDSTSWQEFEGAEQDEETWINIWHRFNSDDIGFECHIYNFAPSTADQTGGDVNTQENDRDPSDYGKITIVKFRCTETFEIGSALPIDFDFCEELPEHRFTISNGIPEQELTGVTNTYGVLRFDFVEVDRWTIAEQPLDGYQLFYAVCTKLGSTSYAEYSIFPGMQNPTETLSFPVTPGDDFLCNYVDIPAGDEIGTQQDETTSEANITVNTYWCPEGTMFPNTDPFANPGVARTDTDALKPLCTDPVPQVMATLTYVSDPNMGRGSEFEAPNAYVFTDVPPDSYVMTLLANDLGDQRLFCEGFLDNGAGSNTKPYGRFALASSTDTGHPIDVLSDETITCDWFGMTVTDQDVVGVSVTKYQCESMIPEQEIDTYGWYTENCLKVQSGVQFRLNVEFGSPLGSGTTDNNGTTTLYEGIPEYGNYLISETNIPDGYEPVAAFCQALFADGTLGTYREYPISNNGALVLLDGEVGMQCLWFNYADPNVIPQQIDPGDLKLDKFLCTTTPDPMAGYDWYMQNCTIRQDGVNFTLDVPDPGSDISTMTNDTGTSGYIQMLGVEPGTYPLSESAYPDFTPQAVYCGHSDINAMPLDTDYANYPLAGSTIQVDIQSDMLVHCKWFNLQAPVDGISLTIYKWKCDPGTMYGQPESYYPTPCNKQLADVPFTITDSNGTTQFESDIDGHQINGLQGQLTITEMIPAGYGAPVVFCHLLNNGVANPGETVTNGSITLPAANDDYQCNWYNIPLEPFSLTLYKWQCKPGTTYGQDITYYGMQCDKEHSLVPFQITHNGGTIDTTSDTNGRQVDNLSGQITIREMGLPGYGDPVVYCHLLNDPVSTLYTSTNGIVVLPPAMGDDYQCNWYNIPEPESTVTIYKWRCPDGMPAESTQSWFETNCKSTPMDNVTFTLTDSNGSSEMTTASGMVQWTDVASGAVQIMEHVPAGYSPHPYVACVIQNDITTESAPTTVNGVWNTTIEHAGVVIVCDWYNWYLGNGEITVHKRICPEGYDRNAWGADPMMDCTGNMNGITFELDQPDPEIDLYSDTGDSVESAVYFGGLPPGDYTLTEMVDASQYQDIFVWQCFGLNSSAVHPTPLSIGQNLNFKIVGGDEITCYWFNVPYPQYGSMVVSKYNCTTEKYVSDVYCYTNQTGQEFNLQIWNGSTWTTVQSRVTYVSGKVTFNTLDAGEYRLMEPNQQACLIKSSNITAEGNLGVTVGEGTTVYVYNCKTAPPPQKTPTKYPNTGVGSAAENEMIWTPGIELTGLAAMLGIAINRRRLLAGAGLLTAGTAASTLPLLNAQELLPLDSTPVPGTPAPDVFWCATPTAATPDANGTPTASGTPAVDPCNRGAIPTHMRIPVIEVDAPMEYLEIIDGQMQQPTGDTHITWYKETSRLGEIGNGIYAAHVNWYGNPEGIFFRLESLQEGDVIEIDGDDQQTLLYEVQWAQDFPSDEEPPEEALGLTDEVAITLITCGGEWSSALSEYDHRTLVRAVLRE